MNSWWWMGGYYAYIWSAYGIVCVLLLGQGIMSMRRTKQIHKRLQQWQLRQSE